MAAVVTVLMTINLLWNIHQYSRHEEEMREKAAVGKEAGDFLGLLVLSFL